ncbi:MAG: hypothetical protein EBT03_07260 [Betaproteobacteria bacterium]|nr:hypothetical protein [Betaproteobacteria bacterium]NCA16850.1 hypothetical protein [Betaproteobacteria bacterium]
MTLPTNISTTLDSLPCKIVGMSNADYRAADGFSRSYLHAVATQGGDAQRWMDLGHPLVPPSNSLQLGTLFDMVVESIIGGKSIDDLLAVPPSSVLAKDGSRRGKAYDEWASNVNGIVCSQDTEFKLRSMIDSLMSCQPARRLVEGTTETQVSVFFNCGKHRVKVRPDACTPTIWWDLKTTSSKWDGIHRSVVDYGYAEQEWMYVQGAMAIGYEHHRMPFVFVQTMPPHGTRVFYIPEEAVATAGTRMLNAMEIASLRISSGCYEDVDEIVEMTIPRWANRTEEPLEVL